MWSKAQTISLVWVHLNRFDVSGGAKTVISLFGVGRSIQKERRLFPSHIQMQGISWLEYMNGIIGGRPLPHNMDGESSQKKIHWSDPGMGRLESGFS